MIQPPQPNTPRISTTARRPDDETDLKGRLADEYKILQDKIDKIGSFRFTIKGWSVTAVIAASALGSTAGLLAVVTVSVGLILMLGFFFWFEFEQVKLSRLFGDRARRLEDHFRHIDRRRDKTGTQIPDPFLVPYMAHEIAFANYERKHLRRSRKETLLKRWADSWRVLKQADVCFYFVLICVAFLLPLVPRHAAVGLHLRQLISRSTHPAASVPKP